MNVDRVRSWATELTWPALALLVLAACGTSGSGQSGSAFTFLTVSEIRGNAGSSANSSLDDLDASTIVCATLTNTLKNPTVTAPSILDNVTITSYTVTFTRFDGGPPPGPFTVNTAFTVPAGSPQGQATTFVVVVPNQAKRQSPLSPRPPLPLPTNADIVFKGRDGRGNGLSTQGSVTVVFVAAGTEAAAPTSCTAPSPPSTTPTPTTTPVTTPITTP